MNLHILDYLCHQINWDPFPIILTPIILVQPNIKPFSTTIVIIYNSKLQFSQVFILKS